MLEFIVERSESDEVVLALIMQKAIESQYHTYFNWNAKNANQFLSLFGESFLQHMKRRVQKDAKLNQSILDFIEIGSLRNQLVHLNFA